MASRKYVVVTAVVIAVIIIGVSVALLTTKHRVTVGDFVANYLGVSKSLNKMVVNAPFSSGSRIPNEYTCTGADVSPPLTISNVPSSAKSLAVIMVDPDAPRGPFIHWVLYNLRPDTNSIPKALPKVVEVKGLGYQAINDFRRVGYGGPCPPPGSTHRYVIIVVALNTPPNIKAPITGEEFLDLIKGRVIAYGYTYGVFSR